MEMNSSLSPPSMSPVSAHWDHTQQIQSFKYQLFEVCKPTSLSPRPPTHLLHTPQVPSATSKRCGSRTPQQQVAYLSKLQFVPIPHVWPRMSPSPIPVVWSITNRLGSWRPIFRAKATCWDSLSEGGDEGAWSKNQGTWNENYLFALLFF